MRTTTVWIIVAALAALLLLGPAVSAGDSGRRSIVAGTDDWPADGTLEMGRLECPGTEPIWAGPLPMCPEGSNVRLRDAKGYSCFTGIGEGGAIEPRLTGVGWMSMNGNLDPTYSGSVWGKWRLVLSETCDPAALDDPDLPFWEGTWLGTRTRNCQGEACFWTGVLKLVARGRGGPIHQAHLKGEEIATSLTPLPVPYELIPGFCPPGEPCPPEGVLRVVIKTRPRH